MIRRIVVMTQPHRLLNWLLPGILFLAWLVVCETGLAPPYLLPHPKDVLATASSYLFGDAGQAAYAGRFL